MRKLLELLILLMNGPQHLQHRKSDDVVLLSVYYRKCAITLVARGVNHADGAVAPMPVGQLSSPLLSSSSSESSREREHICCLHFPGFGFMSLIM
jgi:hypothetical protein